VPFSVAGGVNVRTITAVERAGAIVVVAGGAIYGADDPAVAPNALRDGIV
jgi:3-hexulose-6-phosphate synthase